MAFGLGRLRLSLKAFWSMTPRELASAMSPFTAAPAAPARDALDGLMALFPDS